MKRPKNHVIKEEVEENHHSEAKKSIKSEEFLKCELCDTICMSISQLQSHTLSEHIPQRKQSSASSSSSSSAPSQRVCCQQCDDTFENFAQFAVHMKSHISSSNMVYFCPICPMGTPFRDKKSQLEHITAQHVQVPMSQLMCHCEATFASAALLSQHFWQSHVKQKFFCTACDFVCEAEKAFKEHSKSHSTQVVMLACALCGVSCASLPELVNHVQGTHDQDTLYPPTLFAKPSTPSPKPNKPRPLQCSVCDETVFGEDGLDEHRLQRHCKVRYADKCADCREPINTENSFVEHCLRHAKDHAHHCPVCRQSLRSDAQINAHCAYHMRKSADHQGEMVQVSTPAEDVEDEKKDDDSLVEFSFACPICGEKTEDGFALMEHCKMHN